MLIKKCKIPLDIVQTITSLLTKENFFFDIPKKYENLYLKFDDFWNGKKKRKKTISSRIVSTMHKKHSSEVPEIRETL